MLHRWQIFEPLMRKPLIMRPTAAGVSLLAPSGMANVGASSRGLHGKFSGPGTCCMGPRVGSNAGGRCGTNLDKAGNGVPCGRCRSSKGAASFGGKMGPNGAAVEDPDGSAAADGPDGSVLGAPAGGSNRPSAPMSSTSIASPSGRGSAPGGAPGAPGASPSPSSPSSSSPPSSDAGGGVPGGGVPGGGAPGGGVPGPISG